MKQNLIATFSEYAAQLREFIHSADKGKPFQADREQEFNRLAILLFELQFGHNVAYRRFCESKAVTPATVRNWQEIPAMPAVGFKEFELSCLPVAERTRVFYSSGTTEQRPSRHFHSEESLAIYETSLLTWFGSQVLARNEFKKSGHEILSLTPTAEQAPNSSLVHMFEVIGREVGSLRANFMGKIQTDASWAIDLEETVNWLRRAILEKRPVMILGTAFNYVHLLDQLAATGERLELSEGSIVLETGGYKGRSRTLPKPKLHALISEWLGVSAARIVCEYGMSELSSQAYDSPAKNGEARRFHFPPWARAQFVSPENGREVGVGEMGLIRIFDLANVYSVMAIQTEDLGVRREDGFELVGRAELSEPRGCSLQSI